MIALSIYVSKIHDIESYDKNRLPNQI